ncbi:MAG: ADP-forming succinate--CoA ligase subunit beta [Chloroflexi bacterium HGW-Chloroflexi-10]|nr:MAG: ADP-forming succinate--CoA ligase subunit beta [Chloroflexi bacterium HGW-Chloroflexi-10]
MKLHEYQSKKLFERYEVPIPKGRVASTAAEAGQIAEELGGRTVIKSQVLVGGRGKAGGIRLAKNANEAREFAAVILGMEIKGLPVRKVLVDEAVGFEQEIYLSIINDRVNRCPVVMASAAGGVDIEEVAQITPEKIVRININPLLGLQDFQARDIALAIDLPREQWKNFIKILHGLYRVFSETDATLAEINPLVITKDQRMLALDAKMIIDDNALFRHPELNEFRDFDIEAPAEVEARKYGLSFIKLDGEIGCMVNGAGLAMASMDIIKQFGGEPANFLDIGGGAGAVKVSAALRIILSDPKVKVILINIFGGITRCDEVANGLLTAMKEVKISVPVVVRLVGTNAAEGRALLSDANVITADTLVEAARKAVALANGGSL